MSNLHPRKPTAAQRYSANNYAAKFNLGAIKIPEWRPLILSTAMTLAFERAANPFKRFSGDGR